MFIRLFLYVAVLGTFFSYAQEGIREIGVLPGEVSETSGLLFYNGKLITHNDSGNTPQLFEIDTVSLRVIRSVTITNVMNTDWEDITQDENYIYIGDIGNNLGNRRDLAIYRVLKSDYDISENVLAERIEFGYEDQLDFQENANANDWDAESLFVFNGQLIVLTKQWRTNGTKAYAIPIMPGSYSAKNVGSYAIDGLVAGATYSPDTETLFIIGYTRLLAPFLAKVGNLTENDIFNGNLERINLNLGFAQAEGIAVANGNKYFFSTESFTSTNPPITTTSRLFSFQHGVVEIPEGENPDGEVPGEEEQNEEELILYRGFGSDILQYELRTAQQVFGRAIFDLNGRRVGQETNVDKSATIDISPFEKSIYYLTFYLQGKIISKPFIPN